MNLYFRDNKRYGIFKAHSNIGDVIVEISKYGWGELIEIKQNKNKIVWVDTIENEDSDSCDYINYEETDTKLVIDRIVVEKPFIRTIKRFK